MPQDTDEDGIDYLDLGVDEEQEPEQSNNDLGLVIDMSLAPSF